MPVVSKKQNAAMHAAAAGHSTLGIPQKVGAEFVAATPKGAVKKLPMIKKPAVKKPKRAVPVKVRHFGSIAPVK